MKIYSSMRGSDSYSDNLKAAPRTKSGPADENPKWLGLVALAIAFLLCGALADAQQQPAKVPKIGWLSAGSASGPGSTPPGFQRDLHALGPVDGKIRALPAGSQSAEDQRDRLHVLAEELVRLNVDVLIASSTAEALALKKTTKTTPIVFMVASDPVADGLVDSLARPGGNITGVTTVAVDLAGKRLELLKQTMPKLSRVAVLWHFQDPSSAREWKESLFAARDLGLELHSLAVSSVDKPDAEPVGRCQSKTDRGAGGKISLAGDIRQRRICRKRRLDVLRTRPRRPLPAHRDLCRQDSQGHETS